MNLHISWRKYIEKTSEMPPRPLLVESLQYVQNKSQALDVGAGALMDSKYLLSEGFIQVTAIDPDKTSLEKANLVQASNFYFVNEPLEVIDLPSETYDLISAQNALTYITPKDFNHVIDKLKNSLKKGGIFVIDTFGEYDENILPNSDMARLSKTEIQNLFSDMEIIKFTEKEEDKESVLGKMKHFHKINLILRK